MRPETQQAIEQIIQHYNCTIQNMSNNTGGEVRGKKGQLVEYIAHQLVETAWIHELQQSPNRLVINSEKIRIDIQQPSTYIDRLPQTVQNDIQQNSQSYFYNHSVDKHVFIDGQLVAGIECKAYLENAMLKRSLMDFEFLKRDEPNLICYVFQLESALGGDYIESTEPRPLKKHRSPSTHTIMSYFPNVDLKIFTFIKGSRNSQRPINQPEFFKPLEIYALKEAIIDLCDTLEQYTRL